MNTRSISLTLLVIGMCVLVPRQAAAEDVRLDQVANESSGKFIIGFMGSIGIADVFELSQDDDDGDRQELELHASPTAAMAPTIDYKLSDVLAVGAEVLFLWVEHEDDGDRRLLINPHARLRLTFPVSTAWTAETIFGVGASIWEEDDETDNRELDAIRESRSGLSLRMGFGANWALTELLSTNASISYTTSITFGEDQNGESLTARFGTVLFTLGARIGI